MRFNPRWQSERRGEKPCLGQKRGYSQVKKIGSGGFGVTVLVRDPQGELCVMKTIDISRLSRDQQEDAVNEAKVLASLKHPYIVRYRESFLEGSSSSTYASLAIVMEYCEGGDLQNRIARTKYSSGSFSESQILAWIAQVLLVLKYIHGRLVIHRDLKSGNLFLTKEDQIRVGDFGISKCIESSSVVDKSTLGSPYYLAPEICTRNLFGPASDIWALGVIVFELIALKVPFEAQNLTSLMQRISAADVPNLPQSCSRELRQLCRGLLQRDHTQRPTTEDVLQLPIIQNEIGRMYHAAQAKRRPSQSPEPPAGVPPPPGEPVHLADDDVLSGPKGSKGDVGSGSARFSGGYQQESEGAGVDGLMRRPRAGSDTSLGSRAQAKASLHELGPEASPLAPGRTEVLKGVPLPPSRVEPTQPRDSPEGLGGLPPRPPSRAEMCRADMEKPSTPSGLLSRTGSAALLKPSGKRAAPGLRPEECKGRDPSVGSVGSRSSGGSSRNSCRSLFFGGSQSTATSRGTSPAVPRGLERWVAPSRCGPGFTGLGNRSGQAMLGHLC
eukprot:TRINITY_DN93390_c0_g1_i1.p1 TRINITY_DN93390_c0_g1~~TRINITY_DN93390_c0_g1_i1.p1  ORF type:complete len:564 (-),score=74.78 TRINITY_DN93390_c0_g1_i1:109-1770(-)